MFYDIRRLLVKIQVEGHEYEIFHMFTVKIIKSIINIFKKLRLYSFLRKIPQSILHFINLGVGFAISGDKEYNEPIYKNIEYFLGDKIIKKYGNAKKDFIIRKIIKANFVELNRIFFDIVLLLPYFNIYRRIDKYFEVKGLDNLDKALSKRKGVIILSAHISNYLFLLCYFALKGYKTHAIIEIQNFTAILKTLRGSGLDLIPSPQPHFKELKDRIKKRIDNALKNNEILIIFQDFGYKHYTLMNFFDELCYTPVGVASLALKHGSSILPAFIQSSITKHLHKITIHPEFKLNTNFGTKNEIIMHNVYEINKLIEKKIIRKLVRWALLPVYHSRKRFDRKELYHGGSILNQILHRIDYYKEILEISYEPGRDDQKIQQILDEVSNNLKILKGKEIGS
jgi:KDO2-lipid IV(A) lauroyltransferase